MNGKVKATESEVSHDYLPEIISSGAIACQLICERNTNRADPRPGRAAGIGSDRAAAAGQTAHFRPAHLAPVHQSSISTRTGLQFRFPVALKPRADPLITRSAPARHQLGTARAPSH